MNKQRATRGDITKQIWKYIKEKNLQDEGDRRYITFDETLKNIFNTERINMMQLGGLIAQNTSKKPIN